MNNNILIKTRVYVTTIICIFVCTLLTACSEGGDSDSNPTLEKAVSFSQALDILDSDFKDDVIASWRAYDGGFDDYVSALNWSQDVEPIDGIYLNYVQAGQGIDNAYPVANGEVEFIPPPQTVRLLNYQALDFTTGQFLPGEFQTFYGI